MSETNAERMERLKVLAGNSDYFGDLKWVIEQAERALESEKKVEYYGDEHCRMQNLLAETAFENKRLREAITLSLEKHKWNNEESARILEEALEGTK